MHYRGVRKQLFWDKNKCHSSNVSFLCEKLKRKFWSKSIYAYRMIKILSSVLRGQNNKKRCTKMAHMYQISINGQNLMPFEANFLRKMPILSQLIFPVFRVFFPARKFPAKNFRFPFSGRKCPSVVRISVLHACS